MIRIESGLVVTGEGLERADVLIENDRVAVIGELGSRPSTDEVIDARGCWVGPGLVDIHVHLREPGQTHKEDIETGSRAAAAGGFTAIVAMPNTEPAMDDTETIRNVSRRGREVGLTEVAPAAAATTDRRGEETTDIEGLYAAGVRIFTDDGDSVGDTGLTLSILERIGRLDGAVLSQHAEDASMTVGGHMHECGLSRELGIGGLPSEAETTILSRDLDLVRMTGARYHCQHVSAAASVRLIRLAKAEGLPVTAEVTPHHLSFEVSALRSLDTNLKMYPPIREESDRKALIDALRDGTIDVVATDHAPHTAEEKAVPFPEAPRGVIGLETAASAVHEIVNDPTLLFGAMSSRPAHVAGLDRQGGPLREGGPANVMVFDPDAEWVCEGFVSKSMNSPYRGRRMLGRVRATIYEGAMVHHLEGVR